MGRGDLVVPGPEEISPPGQGLRRALHRGLAGRVARQVLADALPYDVRRAQQVARVDDRRAPAVGGEPGETGVQHRQGDRVDGGHVVQVQDDGAALLGPRLVQRVQHAFGRREVDGPCATTTPTFS